MNHRVRQTNFEPGKEAFRVLFRPKTGFIIPYVHISVTSQVPRYFSNSLETVAQTRMALSWLMRHMLVIENKIHPKGSLLSHVFPCVRVRYIQRKAALSGECCKFCYRRTLSGLHRGDGVKSHSPPLESLFFIPPKPCFCHCPKVKSWRVEGGAGSF